MVPVSISSSSDAAPAAPPRGVDRLTASDLNLAPVKLGEPRLIHPALSAQGKAAQLRLIATMMLQPELASIAGPILEALASGYDKQRGPKAGRLERSLEHFDRERAAGRKADLALRKEAAEAGPVTLDHFTKELRERGVENDINN